MHEMDKCEAVCFRARQNPCAERSKDFFNSAGKEDHEEEGFEETQVAYRAVLGVEI
jgi:hypothetical protein